MDFAEKKGKGRRAGEKKTKQPARELSLEQIEQPDRASSWEQPEQRVKTLTEKYEVYAVSIRRRLHENPELSMEEMETTALIKEELGNCGIQILDIGLLTGAAGVLEGKKGRRGETGRGEERGNRTLLLRADIDALPVEERSGLSFSSRRKGICHSCGHDIHTASLLLAARVLSELREEFSGRILFLFQPAEETGEGAKQVIESGLLERYKPDLAYGMHCWPELPGGTAGFRPGAFMAASDFVKIRVRGRGGHGAHPHKSVDPVTAAAYLLTELQTVISRNTAPLDPAVLTIGKIIGGTAANVIPDEVQMEGTVRTVSRETRNLVEERIRNLSVLGAQALGAECEVEYRRGVPALINDKNAVRILMRAAENQLGADSVRILENPSMGSEDFARYLEEIPGAMFRIGTANENPASGLALHNAGIVFDERAISVGAAVMSSAALEALENGGEL